jgi:hypothetical protein
LEPAAGVRRDRHTCRSSYTRIDSIQEIRTIALEAIRHDVLKRQQALVRDSLSHRCGQLWFGVQRYPRRHLAVRPAGGIRVAAPHFWQADWNSHSSSMKPATSLGSKSNVGRENPSPSVRHAGNIRCLLAMG